MKNDEGWLTIIGLAALIIIIVFIVMTFTWSGSPGNTGNIETTNIVKPVDYGNGVYYFDCVGATFTNSLSAFIVRENVTVLAMAGDGNGGYGANMGYFVVVQR